MKKLLGGVAGTADNFLFLIFFNFFGHAMQHAGSQFSDQGWNLCLLQWEASSLNPWTNKEVP